MHVNLTAQKHMYSIKKCGKSDPFGNPFLLENCNFYHALYKLYIIKCIIFHLRIYIYTNCYDHIYSALSRPIKLHGTNNV